MKKKLLTHDIIILTLNICIDIQEDVKIYFLQFTISATFWHVKKVYYTPVIGTT